MLRLIITKRYVIECALVFVSTIDHDIPQTIPFFLTEILRHLGTFNSKKKRNIFKIVK